MSRLDTLPDILEPGLRVVSVGLNPSIPSVERGYYFANPRNRFWKAMWASGILSADIAPGAEAQRWLLENRRIGFTDLVKRPTRGVKDLRGEDYAQGAPELLTKLLRYKPGIVWFHGKVAYGKFLSHAGMAAVGDGIDWGRQRLGIGRSIVFVTPNPSPANAAYSLAVIAGWYRKLWVEPEFKR